MHPEREGEEGRAEGGERDRDRCKGLDSIVGKGSSTESGYDTEGQVLRLKTVNHLDNEMYAIE